MQSILLNHAAGGKRPSHRRGILECLPVSLLSDDVALPPSPIMSILVSPFRGVGGFGLNLRKVLSCEAGVGLNYEEAWVVINFCCTCENRKMGQEVVTRKRCYVKMAGCFSSMSWATADFCDVPTAEADSSSPGSFFLKNDRVRDDVRRVLQVQGKGRAGYQKVNGRA